MVPDQLFAIHVCVSMVRLTRLSWLRLVSL